MSGVIPTADFDACYSKSSANFEKRTIVWVSAKLIYVIVTQHKNNKKTRIRKKVQRTQDYNEFKCKNDSSIADKQSIECNISHYKNILMCF